MPSSSPRSVVRSNVSRRRPQMGEERRLIGEARRADRRPAGARGRIGWPPTSVLGIPSPSSSTGFSPCQVSAGSTTSTFARAAGGAAATSGTTVRCAPYRSASSYSAGPAARQSHRQLHRSGGPRAAAPSARPARRSAQKYRCWRASTSTVASPARGHGGHRWLGGEVADGHAGVRGRARRGRQRRREPRDVAGGVGQPQADQVRALRRRPAALQRAVPQGPAVAGGGVEALDQHRPAGQVGPIDVDPGTPAGGAGEARGHRGAPRLRESAPGATPVTRQRCGMTLDASPARCRWSWRSAAFGPGGSATRGCNTCHRGRSGRWTSARPR